MESLRAKHSGGVHTTNQPDRLSRSQCFQKSESLNCMSCHDPHHLERADVELFSKDRNLLFELRVASTEMRVKMGQQGAMRAGVSRCFGDVKGKREGGR